ncbi:MAG: hypothetical protein ACTHJM_13545 [Marmoricola sp.]
MTTTSTLATQPLDDSKVVKLVQAAVAVCIPGLLVFAFVATFQTTISDGGSFRYTADYWYTAVGLPISVAGIALTLGLHRLQRGRDGRLGTVGAWVATLAMVDLFALLTASLIEHAEVRWGPSYPVATLLTFIGLALLVAGSWRSGILPKWMLGLLPPVWITGTFAAQGLTPLILVAFLVVLATLLPRGVTR